MCGGGENPAQPPCFAKSIANCYSGLAIALTADRDPSATTTSASVQVQNIFICEVPRFQSFWVHFDLNVLSQQTADHSSSSSSSTLLLPPPIEKCSASATEYPYRRLRRDATERHCG